MTAFAEVIVTLPVEGRFHYAIPEHLQGALEAGHRVLVPFGRRKVTGFVVALSDEAPEDLVEKVRPIEARLDVEPLVPAEILRLTSFCADYYLAPSGEVLKLALPPGLASGSVQALVATAAGRRLLETEDSTLTAASALSPEERVLLRAAARGQGVRGSKAKSKTAARLREAGWATLKEHLHARDSGGETTVAARTEIDPDEAMFARAPVRRRVYEMLANSPVAVDEIEQALGKRSARAALRRLQADGLVVTQREAAARGQTAASRPVEVSGEPIRLSPAQAEALSQIGGALDDGRSQAFLLQGVTGSGKTEVYLAAIEHARRQGRGAIVLVPEIALTPQLAGRFRARFGDDVAVLHSAVGDAERRRRWHRLRAGEANIALGARSAIWAPVRDLAIIAVDEEHDPSFKQGSDVRYNARDLALLRARRANGVAVLGSATPSLETMHLVRTERLSELRLPARFGNRPMPAVRLVNLAEERRAMKGEVRLLSRALADALREVVARDHQVILFLNRRGFNTIVHCEGCASPRKCPHCDVSLTHHRPASFLACHYCGHREPLERPCRECGHPVMLPHGAGTQRVVSAVEAAVPDAKILRLDRDVTTKAGALERTLADFRAGRAQILVGTQMVAKGHDFPRVTLVGIILADASLAFPDFRAAERTFQLLTQVAGRAGRADEPGQVIIQTFQPQHYAIQCAIQHDADRFFELECAGRRDLAYPPFSRIGLIRVESAEERDADRVIRSIRSSADRFAEDPEIIVRGPVPAPIPRLRDRHRRILMIRAPTPARLVAVMSRIRGGLDRPPRRVDVIFDVDPIDLL